MMRERRYPPVKASIGFEDNIYFTEHSIKMKVQDEKYNIETIALGKDKKSFNAVESLRRDIMRAPNIEVNISRMDDYYADSFLNKIFGINTYYSGYISINSTKQKYEFRFVENKGGLFSGITSKLYEIKSGFRM